MKIRPFRLRTGAVILLGCLLIAFMLRWFEHSQVFHPSSFMEADGSALGIPFEEANFRSADGVSLHGWFYPGRTNSVRAQIAVLLCHGNAGNICHRLEMCQAIIETGVSVLLFDYRGYGRSKGHPSEEGTYQDATAAHQWLVKRGFEPGKIVVYGESLGGGVAAELALRRPVAGLVLQSTFTSIPEIGAELFPWLPVRLLSSIHYETQQKLPRIHVPVLVMHSRSDGLIGFNHAERNFAVANEPKLFVEIRGYHNDPLTDRAAYVGGIEKLLDLIR